MGDLALSPVGMFLQSPAAAGVAACFGAVWGSFLGVCVSRVPRHLSVVRPGSRCDSCGTAIRAYDNIPVLSYLMLRGRCRSCGARFSARNLIIEVLAAGIAAGLWLKLVAGDPDQVTAVRLARFTFQFAFSGVLIVLAFIDLETLLLPDIITLPAIPVLFLAGFGAHQATALERLIGAAAGYLFVRLIADFYYYVLKREGIGLGDGKLLAVVGAALGWKALPFVVFGGAFVGAVVSIPLVVLARRRGKGEPGTPLRHVQIPFGPFLAASAVAYLFLQPLAGPALLELLLAT